MPESEIVLQDTSDDFEGLLHCVRFRGGRSEACSFREAIDVMENGEKRSPADFIWLHVEFDQPSMVDSLVNLGLSEAAVSVLTVSSTRPRYISFADGEILVVRGINRQDPHQPDDMISLRLYFNESIVVSCIRQVRRLESIGDVLQQLREGRELMCSAELIVALIAQMMLKIRHFVEVLDEAVSHIEEGGCESPQKISVFCNELTLIRRRSAAVKRYLLPQRAALELMHTSSARMTHDVRVMLHELVNLTVLNTEDLELCRERAIVMQEDFRNEISDHQSQRLYLLSLITVIFLPLSFLTGVFGMNVAGLPGTDNAMSFVWVSLFMGVIAVTALVLMRRYKWL